MELQEGLPILKENLVPLPNKEFQDGNVRALSQAKGSFSGRSCMTYGPNTLETGLGNELHKLETFRNNELTK